MPRGRTKDPVALKLAKGTYRGDKDGPVVLLPGGSPVKPPDVAADPVANEFWDTTVTQLGTLLRDRDGPELAELARWHSRVLAAAAALNAVDAADVKLFGRAVRTCQVTTFNFDKLASKFGMTPGDRRRLRIDLTPPSPTGGVMTRPR